MVRRHFNGPGAPRTANTRQNDAILLAIAVNRLSTPRDAKSPYFDTIRSASRPRMFLRSRSAAPRPAFCHRQHFSTRRTIPYTFAQPFSPRRVEIVYFDAVLSTPRCCPPFYNICTLCYHSHTESTPRTSRRLRILSPSFPCALPSISRPRTMPNGHREPRKPSNSIFGLPTTGLFVLKQPRHYPSASSHLCIDPIPPRASQSRNWIF